MAVRAAKHRQHISGRFKFMAAGDGRDLDIDCKIKSPAKST